MSVNKTKKDTEIEGNHKKDKVKLHKVLVLSVLVYDKAVDILIIFHHKCLQRLIGKTTSAMKMCLEEQKWNRLEGR